MFRGLNIAIGVLFLLASCSSALAQTSLDTRGGAFPGGSIIPGYDSRTCDGTIEGAIRYNSSTSAVEFCDGSAWAIPGGGLDAALNINCPNNTLLAHYPFDGNAQDSVGTNHGTLNGDVSADANGIHGSALRFDEASDYVQIPDFALGNDFTVTFWYKADDNTGSGFQYIYSHGTVNTNDSINIYCGEDSSANPGDLIRNVKGNNGGPGSFGATSGSGCNTDWHFYAVPWDEGGNMFHSYLDGGYHTWGSTTLSTLDPATDIFIGGREDLDANRFFGGLIDDIRFYSGGLTSTEIAALYFAKGQCP